MTSLSRYNHHLLLCGISKHTDRDQRSWVLLDDRKNTLPLTENKKILSEKQKPEKYPRKA